MILFWERLTKFITFSILFIRESIRGNTDYGNHIVPGMWKGNLVSRRKVPILRKAYEVA